MIAGVRYAVHGWDIRARCPIFSCAEITSMDAVMDPRSLSRPARACAALYCMSSGGPVPDPPPVATASGQNFQPTRA